MAGHREIISPARILALVAALLVPSAAVDQIASWVDPAAAVVQDKVFVYGGAQFRGELQDGTWNSQLSYRPQGGLLFNISLCNSFNTSTDSDLTALFHQVSYTQDNEYPSYVGGALFTNDYEFYTYGGMQTGQSEAGDSGILRFSAYSSTPDAKGWYEGSSENWALANLSDTSREYALGAWTSAPSENKAYWLGGMRSANNSAISYRASDGDPDQPNTPATFFLEVDMTVETKATARELTYPADNEGRTEGALVWLPYNSQGILLSFGGIQYPADMEISGISPNETFSNDYMTNIQIYDIASDTWQAQQTFAGTNPTQRASFCTVVASASDGSSHHIYVYGGYDGTYEASLSAAYDEVWVLSVPQFKWTLLSEGVDDHRRQNHICVKADAKQMLSIGGVIEFGSALATSSALDVFDLTTGEWTHQYKADPEAEYTVPSTVVTDLGGDSGVSKIPDDLEDTVKGWMSTPYNSQKLRTYTHDCASNGDGNSNNGQTEEHHNATPSWQTPVIAAVAAVVGIAIIATAVWCMCFRKHKGKENDESKRRSILSWMGPSSTRGNGTMSNADSENTIAQPVPHDYFSGKQVYGESVELHANNSNATSPRWTTLHGTPQFIPSSSATSPFLGSVEVPASSPHEIMDHAPRGVSTRDVSIRDYHLYPRSLSGDHIMSLGSGTISNRSDIGETRHYGHISPYELPHDRSNENLPSPPIDLALGEPRAGAGQNNSSHSLGLGADQVQSPLVITPTTPITRKPLNTAGSPDTQIGESSRHHRQQSSLSNFPNLPSPGPEEDQRRSRVIDNLPSGQSSPTQPQPPKRSLYRENLDS